MPTLSLERPPPGRFGMTWFEPRQAIQKPSGTTSPLARPHGWHPHVDPALGLEAPRRGACPRAGRVALERNGRTRAGDVYLEPDWIRRIQHGRQLDAVAHLAAGDRHSRDQRDVDARAHDHRRPDRDD